MNFSDKRRESEVKERQKRKSKSKSNLVSETFATKIKVNASTKYAQRVGVSDRTLEKIRTIKEASTESDHTKEIWRKVASGKVKIDKGYNQVKRFQRIAEAEDFCKERFESILICK